jgi:hypothetical protein
MRAKARDRKVAAIWTALMLAHLFAAAPARAEQESGLAYSRDASHSAIKLAYAESRGASDPGIGPAEWIDPSTLVTYEEDENGEVLRAGARTATRRCGALELRIAGGYLNHGTNGEQGAVDDFAIVEIRVQMARRAGSSQSGRATPRWGATGCWPNVPPTGRPACSRVVTPKTAAPAFGFPSRITMRSSVKSGAGLLNRLVEPR